MSGETEKSNLPFTIRSFHTKNGIEKKYGPTNSKFNTIPRIANNFLSLYFTKLVIPKPIPAKENKRLPNKTSARKIKSSTVPNDVGMMEVLIISKLITTRIESRDHTTIDSQKENKSNLLYHLPSTTFFSVLFGPFFLW